MTAVRRRQLTRLGVWITLATMAVLTAALTARTETGIRRIATLITPAEPVRTARAPAVPRPPDQEAEQRRLSEAVRALAADRDKLLARINTLERHLEDVTGSIPPKAAAPSSPVISAPLPAPQAATALPGQPTGPNQARVAVGHLATGTPAAAESVATKTEFGIDVGGNASIEGLRTLWTTLKAAQPALFDGLRPVIAVREGKSGSVELRLIAGPLPNASIAARLCAALSAVSQACQPSVFDGQRLAVQ
jgi:hypothetical protein